MTTIAITLAVTSLLINAVIAKSQRRLSRTLDKLESMAKDSRSA